MRVPLQGDVLRKQFCSVLFPLTVEKLVGKKSSDRIKLQNNLFHIVRTILKFENEV